MCLFVCEFWPKHAYLWVNCPNCICLERPGYRGSLLYSSNTVASNSNIQYSTAQVVDNRACPCVSGREDAQAPKRVSWAKSGTGSISSKNGTLSSVHTSPLSQSLHHSNPNYTHHPPSDTASILTATGSMAGYRPRPPSAGLPGYNTNATLPHSASVMSANVGVPNAGVANASAGPPSTNGGSLPRSEHAQPQVPRPPPVPTGVTAANISRMGGVPIMVPAQNQAGSLV